MTNPQPKGSESEKQSLFRWAAVCLSIVSILIAAFAFHSCSKGVGHGATAAKEAAIGVTHEVMTGLATIMEKFKTGYISNTFSESITKIRSTDGDVLELATSQSVETFERSEAKYIAWGTVYLGTTTSEISAPATFRYHIRLSGKWQLAEKDHVCCVLAPRIEPTLPVAIDTAEMKKKTESGWALFDKDSKLEELEKSITPELGKRAGDHAHIQLVREVCRQSVAGFVKKWLMKEDHWRTNRFSSIVVVFPGEATIKSDQELEQHNYPPTVKLE